MKGDFTRDTFDPAKHFSRVLMQQGRVQLDADWNEQASILLHYMQTLAADLIGSHGGPLDQCGFEIKPDTKTFWIGPGRYYVDGILCENDARDQDGFPMPLNYRAQPDYPLAGSLLDKVLNSGSGPYAVYLDVWERHITHLDDNLIREVALGGPDTATRAKVIWQVKVIAADSCEAILPNINKTASSGCMQARVKPENFISDPCITPPDSKYRGAENQLYRVEIHEGSLDEHGEQQEWSFKWSRENGSVVAIWLDTNEDGGLVVSNTRGFEAGQWVEVTRETDELLILPGKMTRVAKVEGGALYLESTPEWNKDSLRKIRRWDQSEVGDVVMDEKGAVMPEKSADSEGWIDLEDGIQVWFESNKIYCSGDYWLIPARVATGKIEWPEDKSRRPCGIEHHYAPLAILLWDGAKLTEPDNDGSGDCRCSFRSLQDCPPARKGG